MAPKRSDKVVMKATTKVVQETVQVSIVSSTKKTKPTRGDKKDPEIEEPPSVKDIFIEEKPTPEEVPEKATHLKLEAPPKGKKKAKASTKPAATGEKKRRKRRGKGGGEGYRRYVFRVLKQVHPEMGITSKAMTIINGLMSDMFERLADEAANLSKYTGRMTLSSREIQGAVRLVLPGELGKHAIAEGTKAVTSYMTYKS